MKTADVKKIKQPMDRLLYWIKERESIRIKRSLGLPAPWTDDEILQRYRFCNVRRMDDKVSQWLLKNWYIPFKNHPQIIVAAGLARMFNKPETLKPLTSNVFTDSPRWSAVKETIHELHKSGPVFNGAYIVSTSGNKADKIDWVVDRYVRPLEEVDLDCRSMEGSCKTLGQCYGFSSFMAGQVVADLRWALTGGWSDRFIWAPLGPGSRRGLVRLGKSSTDNDLKTVIAELRAATPSEVSKRCEAIDFQNCLCEFDKYERALWGEGRPKQLYRGGA